MARTLADVVGTVLSLSPVDCNNPPSTTNPGTVACFDSDVPVVFVNDCAATGTNPLTMLPFLPDEVTGTGNFHFLLSVQNTGAGTHMHFENNFKSELVVGTSGYLYQAQDNNHTQDRDTGLTFDETFFDETRLNPTTQILPPAVADVTPNPGHFIIGTAVRTSTSRSSGW